MLVMANGIEMTIVIGIATGIETGIETGDSVSMIITIIPGGKTMITAVIDVTDDHYSFAV